MIAGVVFPVSFLVDMRLSGSSRGVSVFGIGCTLLISGNPPGVLFLVLSYEFWEVISMHVWR